MAASATGPIQRQRRLAEQRGVSESASITSVKAENYDQAQTSKLITTDDAAVDTETNVEGFLVAARATGPVQRRLRRRKSKGGASESSSIASVAAKKSDQTKTSTLTTMDNAAVDTETKVEGFLVAARATKPV